MESWVVGLRDSDDVSGVMPWQQIVYLRLTGQHHRVLQDESTERSERIGDLQRRVYFFLGRCEPAFGLLAIASGRPGVPIQVSPFDTGGVLVTKVPLHREPVPDFTRRDIVRKYTFDGQEFPHRFRQWGSQNFASSSEYTRGDRPSRVIADEVDLRRARDARAWTWEGRVGATRECCDGITPNILIMSDSDFRRYRLWVQNTEVLTVEAYYTHVQMVESIRKSPGTQAAASHMNHVLQGIPQW